MESPLTIYATSGKIISSLGFTTEENIAAIRQGCSGISTDPATGDLFMAGRIDNTRLRKEVAAAGLEAYTRLEQLFILSIQDVLDKTAVCPSSCGLIISTTKGNIEAIREQTDEGYLSEMAGNIGRHFEIPPEPIVISTACISGVSALVIASRLIRSGEYKHIIVAGGDLLSRFVITGFESFKSISPDICRPYDKDRDGLSLGEACGALLVTSSMEFVKEEQPVVIEGGAITNDANHISGPSRTGDGLYSAIRQALKENELSPDDISFINAHGTGTVYNDEMESKALHLAGMDHLPVNSLKPNWGHTLGASGLIESIACLEQLRKGEISGTRGYLQTDVTYPLNISADMRSVRLGRCLKTTSGFGGSNAAIVFSLASDSRPVRPVSLPETAITGRCTIERNSITLNGNILFESDPADSFAVFIRKAYKQLAAEDRKFYKMDDLCKLGYMAAAGLLPELMARFDGSPEEVGMILSNYSASLDTDRKHQDIIDKLGGEEASPAVFVYTLPNLVLGELCIRYKIQGENTFFVGRQYDEDFICRYARIAMERQGLRACLTGWCELDGEDFQATFALMERIN